MRFLCFGDIPGRGRVFSSPQDLENVVRTECGVKGS